MILLISYEAILFLAQFRTIATALADIVLFRRGDDKGKCDRHNFRPADVFLQFDIAEFREIFVSEITEGEGKLVLPCLDNIETVNCKFRVPVCGRARQSAGILAIAIQCGSLVTWCGKSSEIDGMAKYVRIINLPFVNKSIYRFDFVCPFGGIGDGYFRDGALAERRGVDCAADFDTEGLGGEPILHGLLSI